MRGIGQFLLFCACLYILTQIPTMGAVMLDVVFEQLNFDIVAIGGQPDELVKQKGAKIQIRQENESLNPTKDNQSS